MSWTHFFISHSNPLRKIYYMTYYDYDYALENRVPAVVILTLAFGRRCCGRNANPWSFDGSVNKKLVLVLWWLRFINFCYIIKMMMTSTRSQDWWWDLFSLKWSECIGFIKSWLWIFETTIFNIDTIHTGHVVRQKPTPLHRPKICVLDPPAPGQ